MDNQAASVNNVYWSGTYTTTDPWEFVPERFLDGEGKVVLPDHPNRKRLMAFGASRRVCVGETLAKNRLFLMVVSLLQRYVFCPETDSVMPSRRPQDYLRGFDQKAQKFRVRLKHRQ